MAAGKILNKKLRRKETNLRNRKDDNTEEAIIIFNHVILYGHKDLPVFKNLSFSIHKGEKVFILGHTDKERTLILYAILGLLKHYEGEITVFGKELNSLNQLDRLDFRKNIGYAFPQKGLLRNISINDNISLPLRFNSNFSDTQVWKKTQDIMEFFALKDIQQKKAWQLDNFIQKKTSLARAIIHNPAILLIDEPTTYLEENDLIQIKSLIDKIFTSEYISENTAVIIASEDEEWAMKKTNKILCVQKGEQAFFGDIKYFNKFIKKIGRDNLQI